jgi:hypothetical protein
MAKRFAVLVIPVERIVGSARDRRNEVARGTSRPEIQETQIIATTSPLTAKGIGGMDSRRGPAERARFGGHAILREVGVYPAAIKTAEWRTDSGKDDWAGSCRAHTRDAGHAIGAHGTRAGVYPVQTSGSVWKGVQSW